MGWRRSSWNNRRELPEQPVPAHLQPNTWHMLAVASSHPLITIIIVTMMTIAMMKFLSSLSSSQSSVTIQTSWKCYGPKNEKHTHINLSELKMNSHPVILTLLGVWSKPFQGRDQMISKILFSSHCLGIVNMQLVI